MRLKDATLLIVDDDTDILTAVRLFLKYHIKEIITEKNPENIPSVIKQKNIDIVLLDMNFRSAINTGNEGLFWLKNIKSIKNKLPVIMITAYAEVDLAVRSLKEGASDFIVKPWSNDKLLNILKEALLQETHYENKESNTALYKLIGRSEAMQTLKQKIEKVAPTDANILILGENGTGKDLVALALHEASLRHDKPFVKVDMGALTESIFESELFGHKKGAFTDAREDREGRITAANNGTLFLDEIANISLPQQAKLLTALQNRVVTPLGTNDVLHVNIRLISATNASLQYLANENNFRKDLIYRINTITLQIPALRERKEDIEILATHFIKIYTRKYFKPELEITKRGLQKLINYSFPGNVRELQYTVERAVIMTDNPVLDADDFVFSSVEITQEGVNNLQQETNLEKLEKDAILKVIDKHKGNISKAAKELGITRSALYRRLEKYEI